MSLKKRLILSNALIVIIPIVITAVFSLIFIYLANAFSGNTMRYEDFENLARTRQELLLTAETIWREKPETLAKAEFQQVVAARLSGIKAETVVMKDNDTVFATFSLNAVQIAQALTAKPGALSWATLRIGDVTYMVNVHPFLFPDGAKGNILLLAPVHRNVIAAEQLILFTLLVFLISFLVTNTLYAARLSGSIASPLTHLKTGVQDIIRGNLKTRIIEEGDEEIREVARALEQMRIKLEESVETQIKYDDNRKMLISSISHDLKTPITSIKGYIEGIQDGVANTPEKQKKYLETVYSKAVCLDTMIDDLLLYSKLDLNQLPYHFERTDAAVYLEDCVRENEADIEKHGIRLRFDNTLPSRRFVRIDRERMKRVLLNLLDNAVKYMDKDDGEITVILRETENTVVMEVRDNGSGIPPEDIPRVFDRFYRADTARSQAGGSGLGLAIARQIVEDHEGRIWVLSTKGEGTRFMISLARQEETADTSSHGISKKERKQNE
jgi:signal transduction histidine kinase